MEANGSYQNTLLFINGSWRPGSENCFREVFNPADGDIIGQVACAKSGDLDEALAASAQGFSTWRKVSPVARATLMRKAAALLRADCDSAAQLMTLEQGKPLAEARMEVMAAADIIEWFAEEARRTYGRVIPSRTSGVRQLVVKEPVGPVVAFTPWNFPVIQAARKIAAALAAGCSILLKGPEETPASCASLVRAFQEAGLPPGALGLVFGEPGEISAYLIPHSMTRKVSFTGSTAVGKELAALAGRHMKRVTMELGGHAPVIVCDDADVARAAKLLCSAKFRNAGQTCISPTRFLVHQSIFNQFVDQFVASADKLVVGDGLDASSDMGPLANPRRVAAVEKLVAEAVERGATLRCGGKSLPRNGYWFAPTVLTDVPNSALIMNEEPFGPVAIINSFDSLDDAIDEANRLPYALAAYVYAQSARNIAALAEKLESGMVSVNHHGLSFPELPFGGAKESGYGSEGGVEAMEGYLVTKLVTEFNGVDA